jgi:hypothetical protein
MLFCKHTRDTVSLHFSWAQYRDPILKDAIAKHQSRPAGSEKKKYEIQEDETLLDHLVKLTTGTCSIMKRSGSPIQNQLIRVTDHTVLRDEILNIMIAGRDTVSTIIVASIFF